MPSYIRCGLLRKGWFIHLSGGFLPHHDHGRAKALEVWAEPYVSAMVKLCEPVEELSSVRCPREQFSRDMGFQHFAAQELKML